jgi:hypothetical protein
VEVVVPPRARGTHQHEQLAVLDQVIERGGRGDETPAHPHTRIAEMTRRRRALVVLASDMFDPDDETVRALSQLRAQHHDVSLIHVLDPHERSFPYEGLTEFRALESSNKMLVNPAAIRREYQERMDQFLTKMRGTLTAAGVDYHLAETSKPLEDTLLELIVARSRLQPGRRRVA